MKYWTFLLILLFMNFSSVVVWAQTGHATLTVTNEENKAITLSTDDIKAMPHITLEVKAHDEKMHSYSGVLLSSLLQKAGVLLGDSAKKKTVSNYLLITAADKYTVVYALAEVDSVLSDKKIILADEEDDKPLPANALPYQIIATGEKIHARMVRQVVSIAVRKAS